MAKATISMPEDFLLKVSQLEKQTDEILPRVLDVGGEVVLAQTKANLSSVIGSGTKLPSRSTGELEGALGLSKALQDRNGDWNVKVGFSEPRKDGVSNAKLATIIEYGKHGQPAKPFMKPARTKSRKPAIEAMKAKLESEMNG
ncbi:HK97 gp10 family phage protein [Lactococcus garvieae]|uniref:HK97 gp10 family phage protein n=1 Tax=Lactococcus garvieae TaxID=1363 RepID=UPI0038548DE3